MCNKVQIISKKLHRVGVAFTNTLLKTYQRAREKFSYYHEKAYEFFKLSYVTNDRPIFTKEKTT